MTYSEKLKDPRWQKKRLEILERDGWACRNCGDKAQQLHVHHINYESGVSPWDYDDDNLITFCLSCHDTLEKRIKRLRRDLATIPHRFVVMSFCQSEEAANIRLNILNSVDELVALHQK